MRLLPDKSTLIIVGAFNPAILNPYWVAKNCLGITDEQQALQVEMLTPMTAIGSLPPMRYSFAGLTYSATPQRLTFHFDGLDASGGAKVIRVARKLFELLPHTPVNGMGYNFGFSSDQPSAKLAALLKSEISLLDAIGASEDSSIVVQSWGNSISVADELLSVACKYDSANVSIDINAHRNVSDAAAIVAALADDNAYTNHLEQAKMLAVSLNEGDLE